MTGSTTLCTIKPGSNFPDEVTDDQLKALIRDELDSSDETFIRICREAIVIDRKARQVESWRPQFDACSVQQELLALSFCLEIAGQRDQPGSPPDPVRLLEMAEALYRAERDFMLGAAA